MTATTTIEKPREILKVGGKKPDAPAPGATIILASVPQLWPLGTLHRAPENVRHIRSDEDVFELADDIVAHGLLQSLIGYQDAQMQIQVVAGGRRLQALQELARCGLIDNAFQVPVLLRDVEEAIELSLAENIQQRNMSPVDEAIGFSLLMATGHYSPELLAKRFGMSERIVKQRLRIAALASPILNALADRDITLDAAMAYASTSDTAMQAAAFHAQEKRGHDRHNPRAIRHDLALKGFTTSNPVYRFIGAQAYEQHGGTYDEDLFAEAATERQLASPLILETVAREEIARRMETWLGELQARSDLSPTIAGYRLTNDLRLRTYGAGERAEAPKGLVKVERAQWDRMWRTIRNNGIEARILVGIDEEGRLEIWPSIAFVPKDQRGAIEQPAPASSSAETDAQRAARMRNAAIERLARHLAVPPFQGTPLAGRVFWPEPADDRSKAITMGDENGWFVTAQIFVTDAAIAANRREAEAEYGRRIAGQTSDDDGAAA